MACLGPGNFWNDATLASAVSTLEPFAKKDSRYMTACRREGRFATTSAPKPCIMVDSLDLGSGAGSSAHHYSRTPRGVPTPLVMCTGASSYRQGKSL